MFPETSATDRIFCHFVPFCALLLPLKTHKIKILKKWKEKKKKKTANITILHKCTKNHDHTLYCSWDMAHEGCNCYFSFWTIFCPFTGRKMKISKEWKKYLDISSFYTCVPKIMIRWCTVPEIWCVTDGQMDRRTDGCPT